MTKSKFFTPTLRFLIVLFILVLSLLAALIIYWQKAIHFENSREVELMKPSGRSMSEDRLGQSTEFASATSTNEESEVNGNSDVDVVGGTEPRDESTEEEAIEQDANVSFDKTEADQKNGKTFAEEQAAAPNTRIASKSEKLIENVHVEKSVDEQAAASSTRIASKSEKVVENVKKNVKKTVDEQAAAGDASNVVLELPKSSVSIEENKENIGNQISLTSVISNSGSSVQMNTNDLVPVVIVTEDPSNSAKIVSKEGDLESNFASSEADSVSIFSYSSDNGKDSEYDFNFEVRRDSSSSHKSQSSLSSIKSIKQEKCERALIELWSLENHHLSVLRHIAKVTKLFAIPSGSKLSLKLNGTLNDLIENHFVLLGALNHTRNNAAQAMKTYFDRRGAIIYDMAWISDTPDLQNELGDLLIKNQTAKYIEEKNRNFDNGNQSGFDLSVHFMHSFQYVTRLPLVSMSINKTCEINPGDDQNVVNEWIEFLLYQLESLNRNVALRLPVIEHQLTSKSIERTGGFSLFSKLFKFKTLNENLSESAAANQNLPASKNNLCKVTILNCTLRESKNYIFENIKCKVRVLNTDQILLSYWGVFRHKLLFDLPAAKDIQFDGKSNTFTFNFKDDQVLILKVENQSTINSLNECLPKQ